MVPLHLAAMCCAYFVLPKDTSDFLLDANHKGLLEVSDYLMFYGKALASPAPKVILLGASNVKEGLHPAELANHLPGVDVFNISVPGANISEMRSIADLLYDRIPAENWARTTIVLGICYCGLVDDAAKWGGKPNFVDQDRLRFNLYGQTSDGAIEPAVPPPLMPSLGTVLDSLMLWQCA